MARTNRPWGWFETLASGEGYLVKRLAINPHQRLSLQLHRHRQEHWHVLQGSGTVSINGEQLAAQPGDSFEVPCAGLHRAEAEAEGLLILEVQRGELLSEADIERFADDYGRCPG